jgi:hypothetical protein
MFTERGDAIRLVSARKATRRERRDYEESEEYSRARHNKYASQYSKGTLVVTLDPDVAVVFPGAREVNDALRALAGVMKKHRARRSSRRTA